MARKVGHYRLSYALIVSALFARTIQKQRFFWNRPIRSFSRERARAFDSIERASKLAAKREACEPLSFADAHPKGP